ELWDLKVKGTDLASYTQRFQELALLCVRMFSEEADKIEKYVGGLPDMIHGSVVSSKPKTMQEAIEIATELMDKKIRTFAEPSGEKKQYRGSKPLCAKCNYHHDGPCAPKRECPKLKNNNNYGNQGGRNNAPARDQPYAEDASPAAQSPEYVPEFDLEKCHADEPLAVLLDGLHFDDKLHFMEEPVEIVDHEVKRLKRSRIPLV
nr:reverse transcriptase domain-containing protein [Tanacetum cinerariifolium]